MVRASSIQTYYAAHDAAGSWPPVLATAQALRIHRDIIHARVLALQRGPNFQFIVSTNLTVATTRGVLLEQRRHLPQWSRDCLLPDAAGQSAGMDTTVAVANGKTRLQKP